MARELVISADNDGRRVDRVLRTLWPGVPLGAIMKAIRTGEVRLDGKRTKGEARLAEGQRLTVPWEDGAKEAAAPARELPRAKPLETLYKDDFAWIVNKAAIRSSRARSQSCAGRGATTAPRRCSASTETPPAR